MKIKKKQFLDKVGAKLTYFKLPKDMVDQIVSEIEIKYDFERERGKSDDEIIKAYSGAEKLANEYASIFGYNKKHVDKFADNRELTFFDRLEEWTKKSEEIDHSSEKKENQNKKTYKSNNEKSKAKNKNSKTISDGLGKVFNSYSDFSDIFK